MTAVDDTARELLEQLCPVLYPAPSTPVALPIMPTATVDRDIKCLDGLEEDVETEGHEQLAQDNYHRLSTPRGMIPGYPNDGIDLRGYLSKGVTPAVLADIPRIVRGELLKDRRNEEVRVTPKPVRVDDVDGIELKIAVKPRDPGVVPFEMTMSATAFATRLTKVRP